MARIGIDIDDTITDTTALVKEYIEKYDQDYSNDKILINNIYEIIRGFFGNDIIIKFFKDHCLEMGKKYQIRENSKQVINKLKEEGHEIYIISARTDDYFGNANKFCEEYLDSVGIKYDKVITGKLFKVDTCKKENIDIMIDDGVDTCDDINKVGIKAFLYSTEINENKDTISDRVYNWAQVYTDVHNYLDNKNNQ